MARPKEFDRGAIVQKAMQVFWKHGYEGTSTDDLLRAMKIGRQSMYDTFGDKHKLFLESLRCYIDRINEEVFSYSESESPLDAVRHCLNSIAEESDERRSLGCMGVNAATELGTRDPDVVAIQKASGLFIERQLIAMIEAAKQKGELPPGLDSTAAARFVLLTRTGLRVRAKAGASSQELKDLAAFAIDRLM